jgi:hypothetical protein
VGPPVLKPDHACCLEARRGDAHEFIKEDAGVRVASAFRHEFWLRLAATRGVSRYHMRAPVDTVSAGLNPDCALALNVANRRKAVVTDRIRGRDSWADSALTGVASGRTGVRAIAVIPLRAREIGFTALCGRSREPERSAARKQTGGSRVCCGCPKSPGWSSLGIRLPRQRNQAIFDSNCRHIFNLLRIRRRRTS